ncbi:trigger factor [Buchnera aphidicola]|uniref:trigger factor n=1 Tax=Buchnera aphidicola TaxID=9 RepID=UPI0034645BC9
MKFFMEKNKDAGHRVTINIPKDTVNYAMITELTKISKKTNINGFRKGKIPLKIVQEKYGETVYYDVFKELMQKFFYEFIKKEKIKIIGFPKYYMHQQQDKKKEDFEYSVVYELYPKFEIKDIKFIKATKINVKITDDDIKKKIAEYTTNNSLWKTVNGPIKAYDRITIDYSVYEKRKKIDKFDRKNTIFIASNNTLLSILNHKIINHYINDIIFFKIKFHSFHPEKELQNKDITFKIKIIRIEKKEPTELEKTQTSNQKKVLSELYYKNIKDNINAQINKTTQTYLEKQIIEEIIKKKSILIPPILLTEEVEILYQQKKEEYKKYNHNILEREYYRNLHVQAKKRLYIKIIIEKIISENQFIENEKNMQKLIKEISLNYKKPLEIIHLYNKNKNLKNTIKSIDLENQAIRWLIKNIEITKKNWTFDEYINYKWENNEEDFIEC